jgi:hypothetical protein
MFDTLAPRQRISTKNCQLSTVMHRGLHDGLRILVVKEALLSLATYYVVSTFTAFLAMIHRAPSKQRDLSVMVAGQEMDTENR